MISKAYSDFFATLEVNNNKEWFNDNKKTYEREVKAPFLNLISDVMDTVGQWDPRIEPEPKKSLFRINRDIRFSKDKSPYNTIMKAALAPGGRKSGLPGYYIGISADTVHVGGGQFDLDTPTLARLCAFLSENYDELEEIIGRKEFKSKFEHLLGDKVTRLNGPLKDKVAEMPLLLHKQYYAMTRNTDRTQVSAQELLKSLAVVRPLVEFLERGLKS
ncbi:MAG: DUF2461 domain-containing protein [Cyclobacteriaceae bacterium]